METKNKHICVLLCYNNFEHIKKCYESIKNDTLDIFIVENVSKNSRDIETYFRDMPIIGHIRFIENITNNAMQLFVKEYETLLLTYEYITFSDCDLNVDNINSTLVEIYDILDVKGVSVCSIDLDMKNLPDVPGAKGWVPSAKNITDKYSECNTGLHFSTFKRQHFNICKNTIFIDTVLIRNCYNLGGKWVKTLKSKAIHLTWDLYYSGSEYYQFKLQPNLWNHNKTSEYVKIK
jgi:hypothetical protein